MRAGPTDRIWFVHQFDGMIWVLSQALMNGGQVVGKPRAVPFPAEALQA